MVGYNDNLTGPWPVDYINQAVKLDLLDDVNFVGAVPAIRADVAVMTKATLDQNVVDWDKDKDAFVEATKGAGGAAATYSLLEDAFGASTVASNKTVAGISVAATPGTTNPTLVPVNAFEYNADDAELTLSAGGKQYTMTADTVISDGMTFDQLAGHIVNLVLKDANKKTETVAYVDVTSYVKAVEKVNATITDPTVTVATTIKLDDKNYTLVSGYVWGNFSVATTGTPVNSYYYAYFNDDDEAYAVIPDKGITKANKEGVVEEISAKGKFTCHAGSLDQVSDEADVMIIKNGAAAKLADIKEFDVVKQYNTATDKVYLVSAMNSGKLEKVYTSNTTIAGTKYVNAVALAIFDVDGDSASLNDYIGKDVKYLLNAQNELIAVYCGDAATSTTIKGIITDYKKTSGSYSTGALDTITVFKADGTTGTYNVDDGEYAITAAGSLAVTDITAQKASLITVGCYVEFTVDENNNIKTAKTPAVEVTGTAASYTTDDDNNRITIGTIKYNVPEKAVIFNLTKTTDTPAKLDVEILKRADVIDGTSLAVDNAFSIAAFNNFAPATSLVALTTDNDIDVLILTDANATSGTKYGMVEDTGWQNADGDTMVTLYGNTTEYIVDSTGTVPVADAFYDYTISGDTIKFGTLVPMTYAGASDAILTVNSGLVTFTDGGAPATLTQGEITEDTVIVHVAYTPAGGTVIDKISVWDEADLEAGQVVYYKITSNDIDYIIVVE